MQLRRGFSGNELLSSVWSTDGDGRIDYRVVNTGWGIELLRDGDRLTEHCNRFKPNGQYYQAIHDGDLVDWLMIDFTHRNPIKFTIVPNAKLIRVVFASDYASAKILGPDNEALVSKFYFC